MVEKLRMEWLMRRKGWSKREVTCYNLEMSRSRMEIWKNKQQSPPMMMMLKKKKKKKKKMMVVTCSGLVPPGPRQHL